MGGLLLDGATHFFIYLHIFHAIIHFFTKRAPFLAIFAPILYHFIAKFANDKTNLLT